MYQTKYTSRWKSDRFPVLTFTLINQFNLFNHLLYDRLDKTILQSIIIIILFIIFSFSSAFFWDGHESNGLALGSPLPWITVVSGKTNKISFHSLNLTVNITLFAVIGELAIYGDSRIIESYRRIRKG